MMLNKFKKFKNFNFNIRLSCVYEVILKEMLTKNVKFNYNVDQIVVHVLQQGTVSNCRHSAYANYVK